MTAAAAGLRPDVLELDDDRRPRLAPAEGWLTVALVAVLAFALGWAIDDARWVLGRDGLLDFLPWAGVGGVLAGLLGAKAGLGRWPAHLAGATVAALLVPVVVGAGVLGETAAGPLELYRATAASTAGAWIDLAILDRPLTRQFGHFTLVLGLLSWATGQFAGYAVFGHRRPLDAVVVVGLVLLGNIALTRQDQLAQLIVFTLAALLLLARMHAFDEQTTWVRRRIGDPAAVRSLYLRGGAAFVATAVMGSLVLTWTASSDPLRGLWSDAPQVLIDLSQRLQRYLPIGGQSRPIGIAFGEQALITGSWSADGSHALTIGVPAGETARPYWRAVAYDQFDFTRWSWSETEPREVGPGDELLAGLADEPRADGRRAFTFTVRREAYGGAYILAPQSPVTVDAPGRVLTVGDEGFFGALELRNRPAEYTVTSLIPLRGEDDPLGLTQNRLRAAGRDYPADIAARYLEVPPDALGPHALALLEEIKAVTPDPTNPFELAETMKTYLRRPANFRYTTDVQHLDCSGISVVECFAQYREGYCQYYATTMAMLLRQEGIPTRFVEGFLPGDRADGVETILNSSAHAWVEVYFPGYGWVEFDPTGGGVARDVPLPRGAPVEPLPSRPAPSPGASIDDRAGPERRSDRPEAGAGSTRGDGGGPGLVTFVVLAVVLGASVGGLAFVAWQRGPRGNAHPDALWRGVGELAARFGFGPRPNQTVYEYAALLGETLPAARPELETVARAKVEVAYGRQALGEDRLQRVREAHRRLRVRLLRLALHRRGFRRRP